MKKFITKEKLIDFLGMFSIGVVCLCYIFFRDVFAEIRIDLPFLDFPIFVGEMLFGFCTVLAFIKRDYITQFKKWRYLWLVYILFILIKAFLGYLQWGPLALRHSAMFYYPAFIFFSYIFFRKEFLNQALCVFFSICILIIFHWLNIGHWSSSFFILGVVLVISIKARMLRYLMVLLLLIVAPYISFLNTARMIILGNFVAFVFLLLCCFYMVPWRLELKVSICVMLAAVFVFVGYFCVPNKARIQSIFNISDICIEFRENMQLVRKRRNVDVHRNMSGIHIFNPTNQHLRMSVVHKGYPMFVLQQLPQLIAFLKDKIGAVIVNLNSCVKTAVSKVTVSGSLSKKGSYRLDSMSSSKNIDQVSDGITDSTTVSTQQGIVSGKKFEPPSPLKPLTTASGVRDSSKKAGLQVAVHKKESVVVKPKVSMSTIDTYSVKRKSEHKLFKSFNGSSLTMVNRVVIPKKLLLPSVEQRDNFRKIKSYVDKVVDKDKKITKEKIVKKIKVKQKCGNNKIKDDKIASVVVKKSDQKIGNILFRLFIWHDVLVEIEHSGISALWGADFGKPFISPSLVALRWGIGEWSRDGWIAIHNSYLNMIYRAGIVGVGFVIFIFSSFFRLIKRFIQLRSYIGVLLCGIFVIWFVAANFLLIFEMPYTAIPIWALYGVTLAYCKVKTEEAWGDEGTYNT